MAVRKTVLMIASSARVWRFCRVLSHYSISEPVPADCRLRVPVKLRAELPGGAGRLGGMAVPAAPGFPERVRSAAGPGRRLVPVRSHRDPCAAAPAVCAGDDGAGNDLADPDGMDDRS